MVRYDFSIEDAETLIRVLNHVCGQAEGTGASNYMIDTLCRKDCAARFRRMSAYIASKLPASPAHSKGDRHG